MGMHDSVKHHSYDSRRYIVLKAGTISFDDTRIGCLVLNMSTGGAGLILESDAALPLSFDLEINDERLRRRCRAVWRDDRQIGIAFNQDRPHKARQPASEGPDLVPSLQDMDQQR
jgi:PilZ domain